MSDTKLLIKGSTVVDPYKEYEQRKDVLIENGKIVAVEDNILPPTEPKIKIIEAKDKVLLPGLIDMHVHAREPGREDEEMITTAAAAALAGGFTTILCMPNTQPPIDNPAVVDLIKNKHVDIEVKVAGAISKNLNSNQLTMFGELVKSGILAFTNDHLPVANSKLMRNALEYSCMFDTLIISHCEDLELSRGGVMNEGYWSTVLGLQGIPAAAEEIMVTRDIALLKLVKGARLHLAHISSATSLIHIKQAKEMGLSGLSCEVTPHHLLLTDEALQTFDTNLKVNPPLRTSADREALIEALYTGLIDVIATDHAPHTLSEKQQDFLNAPFGIVGLETALVLLYTNLVKLGRLSWLHLAKALSYNPARLLRLKDKGAIFPGYDADLVLVDPNFEYKIDTNTFRSKSKNTPFSGWEVCGKITTIKGGICLS